MVRWHNWTQNVCALAVRMCLNLSRTTKDRWQRVYGKNGCLRCNHLHHNLFLNVFMALWTISQRDKFILIHVLSLLYTQIRAFCLGKAFLGVVQYLRYCHHFTHTLHCLCCTCKYFQSDPHSQNHWRDGQTDGKLTNKPMQGLFDWFVQVSANYYKTAWISISCL